VTASSDSRADAPHRRSQVGGSRHQLHERGRFDRRGKGRFRLRLGVDRLGVSVRVLDLVLVAVALFVLVLAVVLACTAVGVIVAGRPEPVDGVTQVHA
jgi:hypothetical protein